MVVMRITESQVLESEHHTNLSYYQELFLTDVRIKGIQNFSIE